MGLAAVVSSTQADLDTLVMNGLNGLLIYLFAYLFTNVGAFMVVLAVEEFTGSHDISAYEGLVRRAPMLAWAMLIFLLSLTGIPATGGGVPESCVATTAPAAAPPTTATPMGKRPAAGVVTSCAVLSQATRAPTVSTAALAFGSWNTPVVESSTGTPSAEE